jgi:peptidoglycan-associated lipoprotein
MADSVKKLPTGFAFWLLLALIASVVAYAALQKNGLPSAPEAVTAPLQGGISVEAGSEEDFMVNVGRRIFFAEGSAALDETALMTLDKQVEWLGRYPQWKVKLQGSADDPGDPQTQTALSQKRAEAVRDYLVSKGIARERLLAKGYGRDKIGTDCAEIECQSQNRRVITNLQETPEF